MLFRKMLLFEVNVENIGHCVFEIRCFVKVYANFRVKSVSPVKKSRSAVTTTVNVNTM